MVTDCTNFLQWALPQLNLRWAGFRKVRKQVCKRIRRRMNVLGLESYEEYQSWLKSQHSEWEVLDNMCRISISTFYRDWAVFNYLKDELLPELARLAQSEKRPLRCWSAGCASGEEPYTLSLIWDLTLRDDYPDLDFQIIATDIDEYLLKRARTACYQSGTLKGLPETWLSRAFDKKEDLYCIQDRFKKNIQWFLQDIRESLPIGKFDLVLCRNLVATYFDLELQLATFGKMKSVFRPNGYLILGCHEKLPQGIGGFKAIDEKLVIYQVNCS